MKNATKTTLPAVRELKNLEFVRAGIYSNDCNVKGEPVSDISCDKFSFSLVFPTSMTVKEITTHTNRIIKSVNMHDELVRRIKMLFTAWKENEIILNDEQERIMELIKQAE